MDFSAVTQVIPSLTSKVAGGDWAIGRLLLMSFFGMSGIRLLLPLLGGVSRMPMQMMGSRRVPALGGGLIGSLFTLGAWVSAACAVMLLLSPHTLPHALLKESALGPVLLFFAVCALLLDILRSGVLAVRLALWVGVCFILYAGPFSSNGGVSEPVGASVAQYSRSILKFNPDFRAQAVPVTSRGSREVVFQRM